MDQEPTKLTFARVRGKGESAFYDPQSDIRKILPAVEKLVLLDLQTIYKDDPYLQEEFLYLQACYNVFMIRVVEDPSPIDNQIRDFTEAVLKVSPRALLLWNISMFSLLNSMYALFARRDAQVDGKAVQDMLSTSQLSDLCSVLSERTQTLVHNEYRRAGEIFTEQCRIAVNGGYAFCEETKQVIDHIKENARYFISAKGCKDWKSLARACDEAYEAPGAEKRTDAQNISLALAYPSYEKLNLMVDKDNDNT